MLFQEYPNGKNIKIEPDDDKLEIAKNLPDVWPEDKTSIRINFITDYKNALDITELIYESIEEGLLKAEIFIQKSPLSVMVTGLLIIDDNDMFIKSKEKRDSLIKKIKKKLLEYLKARND